ncbi:MAG: SDR family oxidoreductase [Anaerolineae bacterium]|nr:SDR family oxidoreductase [Anaerolineae bacterium]
MSDNKILVIGATGNVGRVLTRRLAEMGEPVKAATRQPQGYGVLENVEPVLFDYDQPDTWAKALTGVDRVFSLTKNADVQPDKTVIPFFDAAKAAGIEHIVFMTAMGVDQAPDALPLRQVEKYLMASGVAYTILRPNWFMQNLNPGFLLPPIQQSGAFYLPAAEAKTSLIDTQDIAAVAAVILTEAGHRGKEYTLTGGEALSYHEAAQIMSEFAGRQITYVPVDDDALRGALTGAGWLTEQAEFMVGLFQGVRQGWAAPVSPAVSQLLGRDPITFTDFARENAAAWR